MTWYSMIKIAALNAPERLAPHTRSFEKAVNQGAAIICAQEHTDKSPERECPKGWEYYRPENAQSNVVYWDPKQVGVLNTGLTRLSSVGFKPLRYLVWVEFETTEGYMKVASIHLPAFKTTNDTRGKEFLVQQKKAADWLLEDKRNVIAGDFNGNIPGRKWLPDYTDACRATNQVPSGPKGQPIDYVTVHKDGPFSILRTLLFTAPTSDHNMVMGVLEGETMVNPAPGYRISEPYGKKGPYWQTCAIGHTGVDFPAPAGARLVAAVDGEIRHRFYGSAFGRHQFAISPDPGQFLEDGEVFYAHTRTRLPDGTRVRAGDFVAEAGDEGNTVGAHLHFEQHSRKGVWNCNVLQNPAPAINFRNEGESPTWKHPKGTKVYQKYLKWKGHEQNDDDHSTSIECWQEMLNNHSIPGGQTLPVTGQWHDMTANETQICQTHHIPPADTPLSAVFVGPKQFAHVQADVKSPYVFVEDEPPADVSPPKGILKGIDISSHQEGINIKDVPADFVIVKATEGKSYVSPTFKAQYLAAKAANRLLGVYHFARPDNNGPVEEASFFLETVKSVGAIGEAILVLDWEVPPLDDIPWVKSFCDYIVEKVGVTPFIYMSQGLTNENNWARVSADYPLWVAYWPSNPHEQRPSVTWAGNWSIWQWTDEFYSSGYTGPLDHNVTVITAEEWRQFAKAHVDPEEPKEPEPTGDAELRALLAGGFRQLARDIESLKAE